jgi:hypothetical protein
MRRNPLLRQPRCGVVHHFSRRLDARLLDRKGAQVVVIHAVSESVGDVGMHHRSDEPFSVGLQLLEQRRAEFCER